jgi:alpha-ketoglutarate-dependent taurine dioxygenase
MGVTTTFRVERLDATFGAVVTGLKLTDLSEAEFAELHQTWLDVGGLIVMPGQHLEKDEQIAFARRFGALEFELGVLTNVRPDGTLRTDESEDAVKIIRGNEGWHCDSTYLPVQAKGAVFSCREAPSRGGQTGWADMCAAYEALDAPMRARIDGLSAYHSLIESQARIGHKPGADYGGYGFNVKEAQLRPMVKVHPETGRKALMVGRHAFAIPGLERDEAERLLQDLADFACQPPRIYYQDWKPGDVVVWDNRCLMHQATPWDLNERRVMYHSRLAGDPATESSLAA